MPGIETLDSTEPLHGHPAEEDAASNLETLRQRVEDLEAFVTRHIGLDWGRVQNPNEPHSNISVESVEFHGGVTQIRSSGIQLASSLWDSRPPPGSNFTASINDEVKKYGAAYFVRDFVEDITAVSRGVHGGYASARSGGTVQSYMLAIDDAAKYAQFLGSFDQTTALAKMSVNGAAGFKYAQLSSTSNGTIFNTQPLDGLWLPVQGSDPTGSDVTQDGMLLYRSDTDKARLRANGAWVYLASESYVDTAVAGAGMPTPVMISTFGGYSVGPLGSVLSTTVAGTAWPTANLAIFIPFVLPAAATVKKLWCVNGGTVSGNIDMGIYDESGTKQVTIGSTAQSGTFQIQEFDVADTALAAGRYYLAIALDNTTGTIYATTGLYGGTLSGVKTVGIAQATSSFALPASATYAVPTNNYVPYCGLSLRTQVA